MNGQFFYAGKRDREIFCSVGAREFCTENLYAVAVDLESQRVRVGRVAWQSLKEKRTFKAFERIVFDGKRV